MATTRNKKQIATATPASSPPPLQRLDTGEDTYLSRDQVAARLQTSKQTIAALVKRGDLPQYSFGQYLRRYKLSDVRKYEERCRNVSLLG